MQAIEAPRNWIGQICFSGLPLLNENELKTAQKSLFSDFIETQQELDQPDKNQQGYGYKYADLNDVLTAIQEAISTKDIAYIQQPVIEGGKTGVHNYLINSKGAIIDFGAYMIDLGSPKPQEYGKTLTYTRRYSISCIFGIASENDDDAESFESKPEFMAPKEVEGLTIAYGKKRKPLVEVSAMAMAGDEQAQQILASKENKPATKIAIKSITKMYKFAENLLAKKDMAEKKINESNSVDKKVIHKEDPFEKAMKAAGEK